MSVAKPNPRKPWLTPRRGRLLFGVFLCIFGLFALAGTINQYLGAQRRTAQVVAEIVKVSENPPGIFTRIFGTFKVTYRFSIENEVLTASASYDVAPESDTAAVEYEPTRPKNNALMLPSREKSVVALISVALFSGGVWMMWRNLKIHKRRRDSV